MPTPWFVEQTPLRRTVSRTALAGVSGPAPQPDFLTPTPRVPEHPQARALPYRFSTPQRTFHASRCRCDQRRRFLRPLLAGPDRRRARTTSPSEVVLPTVYQSYQIIRRNGAVVAFEPSKIAVALMKAFLAVHGTGGAASSSVRDRGATDAERRPRLAALAPQRWHLPHRRRAGPCRARPDAQRPPRSGARLCAVPRAPRSRACSRWRSGQTGRATVHGAGWWRAPCVGPWQPAQPDRPRPARTSAPTSSPSPSWPRPSAICTTACRWRRSTRPPSWLHAR